MELEWADHSSHLDLVLKNHRVGAVYHNTVTILSHNCKQRFIERLNMVQVTHSITHLFTFLSILIILGILIHLRTIVHHADGVLIKLNYFLTHNHWRERNMHKLWWEFKMKHLGRKMLSSCVMNSNGSILAAGNKKITRSRISKGFYWLIELSKLACYTCFFDIKNTHSSSLEATWE